MRILCLILVLLSPAVAAGAEPPFIVLPTMDSVRVKLTGSATYQPGRQYEIRHWPDGQLLSKGESPAAHIEPSGYRSFEINGLKPRLWSPQDPQLYEIELQGIGKVRFGFRAFEIKDRKFHLNGRPIFLRAMPIDPPGRDLPEATGRNPRFIRDYLRLIKSAHVNLIRTETQEWLDACDEVGVMTFQGNYGGVLGRREGDPSSPERSRAAYRDIVLSLANHPSVVIYVLTNEVDYKTTDNCEYLTPIREDLRLVDPTRPVIGNAGFGLGQPGEIYDIHPYWGYYSGNLCDWYRLSEFIQKADESGEPLTLSECVAAYTSDAGVFLTMTKQLATMLRWAGPQEDQRTAALEYQSDLVRHVIETARRMRTEKTGVAGVMPFTYFLGWSSARKAEDLIIKPAFMTLRTVFQPVLISPECWRRNLYAGDVLKLRLCIANDDDAGRELGPSTAEVQVIAYDGRVAASGRAGFTAVPYYTNAWAYASIRIPAATPRGDYRVRCRLIEDGKAISTNEFSISVAPREWVKTGGLSVTLFDPSGNTASALRSLGVRVERTKTLRRLPRSGLLVIGEDALGSKVTLDRERVLAFLSRGGRILCLRQTGEASMYQWLPAFRSEKPLRDSSLTYIHPVGGNSAIFDGLRPRDLRFWNEIGRAPNGVPRVAPVVTPLRPAAVEDLRCSRIWAICGLMLRDAAIAEVYSGRGSIILSQFACVERAEHDPFAAKLLGNLVKYASSASHPGPVDLSKPVRWDLEAMRAGVLVSPVQGFLPHSKTYQHRGSSKGMLGADHRIDGVTLVGEYHHNPRGWIDPVPDPGVWGWGIVYGRLTQPAKQLALRVKNPSEEAASIRIMLDGKDVGRAAAVQPGEEKVLEWPVNRTPGPVKLEIRGDQRLVLLESSFR